jgi:hypothetical protein
MKQEFRSCRSSECNQAVNGLANVIVYCSNSGCTASVFVYQHLLGVTTTSRNSTGNAAMASRTAST